MAEKQLTLKIRGDVAEAKASLMSVAQSSADVDKEIKKIAESFTGAGAKGEKAFSDVSLSSRELMAEVRKVQEGVFGVSKRMEGVLEAVTKAGPAIGKMGELATRALGEAGNAAAELGVAFTNLISGNLLGGVVMGLTSIVTGLSDITSHAKAATDELEALALSQQSMRRLSAEAAAERNKGTGNPLADLAAEAARYQASEEQFAAKQKALSEAVRLGLLQNMDQFSHLSEAEQHHLEQTLAGYHEQLKVQAEVQAQHQRDHAADVARWTAERTRAEELFRAQQGYRNEAEQGRRDLAELENEVGNLFTKFQGYAAEGWLNHLIFGDAYTHRGGIEGLITDEYNRPLGGLIEALTKINVLSGGSGAPGPLKKISTDLVAIHAISAQAKDAGVQFAGAMGQAFAQLVSGGKDAGKNFGDAIKQMLQADAAWAAERAIIAGATALFDLAIGRADLAAVAGLAAAEYAAAAAVAGAAAAIAGPTSAQASASAAGAAPSNANTAGVGGPSSAGGPSQSITNVYLGNGFAIGTVEQFGRLVGRAQEKAALTGDSRPLKKVSRI